MASFKVLLQLHGVEDIGELRPRIPIGVRAGQRWAAGDETQDVGAVVRHLAVPVVSIVIGHQGRIKPTQHESIRRDVDDSGWLSGSAVVSTIG